MLEKGHGCDRLGVNSERPENRNGLPQPALCFVTAALLPEYLGEIQ